MLPREPLLYFIPGWETDMSEESIGTVESLHFCNVQCPGGGNTAPSLFYNHVFDIALASVIVSLILIAIYFSEKRYQANRTEKYGGFNNNVMYFKALSPK